MSCLVFSILFDMNHCHVLSHGCPYITLAAPSDESTDTTGLEVNGDRTDEVPGSQVGDWVRAESTFSFQFGGSLVWGQGVSNSRVYRGQVSMVN